MARHGNRIVKKVYITEHEERLFKQLQRMSHMGSFSGFARHAMLHFGDYGAYSVIVACRMHHEQMKKRNGELSAIGNNINQIAHQVNTFALQGEVDEGYFTDTVVPAIEKLQSTYMQILAEDEKIKKRLYGKKSEGAIPL